MTLLKVSKVCFVRWNSFFYYISFFAFSQWEPIGPYGGPEAAMIDINDTLFAASENGIFKSTNNGDEWKRESNGMPAEFKVKKFLYKDGLLLVGTNSGIFQYSFLNKNWGEGPNWPVEVSDFANMEPFNTYTCIYEKMYIYLYI